MLIARSRIASLYSIPDDIDQRPDLLKLFKDEYGHTQFIHFETDDYKFEWESQKDNESVIRLKQQGGYVCYQLNDYVPYIRKYGDVTDYLLPEEQNRQRIAIEFIKDAIQKAIKLVR